jgi:hypothetical protein
MVRMFAQASGLDLRHGPGASRPLGLASTIAWKSPACFHPNALQNRCSARSPVGLFALRMTPRRTQFISYSGMQRQDSGGVRLERSIGGNYSEATLVANMQGSTVPGAARIGHQNG